MPLDLGMWWGTQGRVRSILRLNQIKAGWPVNAHTSWYQICIMFGHIHASVTANLFNLLCFFCFFLVSTYQFCNQNEYTFGCLTVLRIVRKIETA